MRSGALGNVPVSFLFPPCRRLCTALRPPPPGRVLPMLTEAPSPPQSRFLSPVFLFLMPTLRWAHTPPKSSLRNHRISGHGARTCLTLPPRLTDSF